MITLPHPTTRRRAVQETGRARGFDARVNRQRRHLLAWLRGLRAPRSNPLDDRVLRILLLGEREAFWTAVSELEEEGRVGFLLYSKDPCLELLAAPPQGEDEPPEGLPA